MHSTLYLNKIRSIGENQLQEEAEKSVQIHFTP
jgi:hypothetical protein